MTTLDGLVTDYVLTPANVDDRPAVWDLVDPYHSTTVLGDKVYISSRLSSDLKNEKNINLIFMKPINSKNPYPKEFRQLIFKIRRRIETTFSQLTEQLNLKKYMLSLYGV